MGLGSRHRTAVVSHRLVQQVVLGDVLQQAVRGVPGEGQKGYGVLSGIDCNLPSRLQACSRGPDRFESRGWCAPYEGWRVAGDLRIGSLSNSCSILVSSISSMSTAGATTAADTPLR